MHELTSLKSKVREKAFKEHVWEVKDLDIFDDELNVEVKLAGYGNLSLLKLKAESPIFIVMESTEEIEFMYSMLKGDVDLDLVVDYLLSECGDIRLTYYSTRITVKYLVDNYQETRQPKHLTKIKNNPRWLSDAAFCMLTNELLSRTDLDGYPSFETLKSGLIIRALGEGLISALPVGHKISANTLFTHLKLLMPGPADDYHSYGYCYQPKMNGDYTVVSAHEVPALLDNTCVKFLPYPKIFDLDLECCIHLIKALSEDPDSMYKIRYRLNTLLKEATAENKHAVQAVYDSL